MGVGQVFVVLVVVAAMVVVLHVLVDLRGVAIPVRNRIGLGFMVVGIVLLAIGRFWESTVTTPWIFLGFIAVVTALVTVVGGTVWGWLGEDRDKR